MRVGAPTNNCLILGAGRSGTSLTALLLQEAGYHVCTRSHPPDEGNPFGYFEDLEDCGERSDIESGLSDRVATVLEKSPGKTGYLRNGSMAARSGPSSTQRYLPWIRSRR